MDLTVIFLAVSVANGLPAHLLEAVCWQESHGRPDLCRSEDCRRKISHGVCQVHAPACGDVGVTGNLDSPNKSIECAGRYLAAQHARYRDWRRAICAYNKGTSTGNGVNEYTKKVVDEWFRRVLKEREPK